ncbi:MAG: hypothetical protein LBU81_01940 [Methanosarcinales archaeon]|jgi:membrane protein implicated in regulation of membrane protease activity|nr:hypothetical protein [Methanosarcinales archaeon]
MLEYFGVYDMMQTGDYMDIALLAYIHTYGIVFWLAIWAVLMIILYIKNEDLTSVMVLTAIMLTATGVYSSQYDFFPIQAVAFGIIIICLISAGVLYRYYNTME